MPPQTQWKPPLLRLWHITVRLAGKTTEPFFCWEDTDLTEISFPSKIEDDQVLSFVIKGDHSIDYAEERRLFYVAMTRTKNRVYFIVPEQNPSEFLLEIKRDYKSVILKGKWNEEETERQSVKKVCPIGGYPMQFRYKNAYGLKLYICTNDQEMCGFMTNDLKAGKMAIMKCDKCRDGYLIAKSAGKGYFLGCTNYKNDKTGCNHTIGSNEYFTLKNMEPDFIYSFVSAVSVAQVKENAKAVSEIRPVEGRAQKSKDDVKSTPSKGKSEDDLYVSEKHKLICDTEYYNQ